MIGGSCMTYGGTVPRSVTIRRDGSIRILATLRTGGLLVPPTLIFRFEILVDRCVSALPILVLIARPPLTGYRACVPEP